MEKKMLSVRDVATELRARGFSMTERAVREEIKLKRLRAYKLREIYYISREDFEAYIKSGETMPTNEEEFEMVG
jgi:repressor of nif and glnA expression